jgi:hypothetical protein
MKGVPTVVVDVFAQTKGHIARRRLVSGDLSPLFISLQWRNGYPESKAPMNRRNPNASRDANAE